MCSCGSLTSVINKFDDIWSQNWEIWFVGDSGDKRKKKRKKRMDSHGDKTQCKR